MHPAIPPAALACSAALCMAAYVALRRDKRELDWLLLGVFVSLSVWTAGTMLRFSAADQEGLERALRVVFLGVFFTPPLWLLVAARYSWPGRFAGRRALWTATLVPSLVAYLALLTNGGHQLVLREVSFEALEAGGLAWAGPLFWVFIAWAYGCVLAGMLLYASSARELFGRKESRMGVALAVASLVPLLTSSIYLFRLLPVSYDLTPSALTVSMLLLCLAVFRYRLLESLPLARRDVIENFHDGVLMANSTGLILDVNRAAEKILGRGREELHRLPLGGALAAFGDGESLAALHAGLGELEPDSPPLVAEVRTEDERRVEVQVAWALDASGAPAGQFAVLRDRTEERRYERVVRHAQKVRTVGTLVSGIAHEVNNPLAFIRANLSQIRQMGDRVDDLLANGGSDARLAGELKELSCIAEETLDGIGRIERIVAGIRRMASNREGSFHRVEVNEVVEDALRLSNLMRDPELKLDVRLASDLPAVDGVSERLVQALLNLLLNARQALDGARGTIEVGTSLEGTTLEIRVRDDGPGVPDAIQERIFDPFFTTKDPDRGTGLGLSIAYDILRDHGGVLELRASPAGGACFVACLPVHP